jgi:spore cortex biosynthesis protein YabQ
MDHINVQLSSLLIVLLAGMIFGVFFDFYRVFRGKIIEKKGRYRTRIRSLNIIGDLCFWGLAFILITPIIFWGTWLELRFYVWLLILIGIGLYLTFFSPVIIPLILGLWRILAWAPQKLGIVIWRIKIFSKKVSCWFSK